MCGGSATTTQKVNNRSNQTSQVQPNKPAPQVYGNILSMAQQAAGLPYVPITQGVAPVNQFQTEALNTTQPFMNAAAGYFNNAAQPLGAEQVNQYYNPYANAVLGNLNEVFGQQMSDVTGKLQQQAGGVGADRIAVGQAELARQQGLAAGQTMASVYQNALQAAQNQQGIQQASAYGLGNLGSADYSAIMGYGNLAQQTEQARKNAAYNQQIAQQAYPFQTAQWYAGLGLPAAAGFGTKATGTGTQTGNQTTTTPPPNPFSQLAGAGVAALGAFGARGGAIKSRASGGKYEGPWSSDLKGAPGYVPVDDANPNFAPPSAASMPALTYAQFSGPSGQGSNVNQGLGGTFKDDLAAGKGLAGLYDEYGAVLKGAPLSGWEPLARGGGVTESEPYQILTRLAGGEIKKDTGGFLGSFVNPFFGMGDNSGGFASALGMRPIWESFSHPSPFSVLGMMQQQRENQHNNQSNGSGGGGGGNSIANNVKWDAEKNQWIFSANGGAINAQDGASIDALYHPDLTDVTKDDTQFDPEEGDRRRLFIPPFSTTKAIRDQLKPEDSGPFTAPAGFTLDAQGPEASTSPGMELRQAGYADQGPMDNGQTVPKNVFGDLNPGPDAPGRSNPNVTEKGPVSSHEATGTPAPMSDDAANKPLPPVGKPDDQPEQSPYQHIQSPYSPQEVRNMYQPPTLFGKPLTNTRLALMAAGLGMMGGTSPFFATNIGEGGLKGLGTLKEFQQLDLDRQAKALEAALRAQDYNLQEDRLTETRRYHDAVIKNANRRTQWTTGPDDEPEPVFGGEAPQAAQPQPRDPNDLSMDAPIPNDMQPAYGAPKDLSALGHKQQAAAEAAYSGAENQDQWLTNMTHSSYNLQTGWMSMGAGGEERANVANIVNTALRTMGWTNGLIPSGQEADAIAIRKGALQLVNAVATTAYGHQREAGFWLNRMMGLLPGIDQNPAAFRQLVANMLVANDYAKEYSKFEQGLLANPRYHGALPPNAQDRFNKLVPRALLLKREKAYTQAMNAVSLNGDKAGIAAQMRSQGLDPAIIGIEE